MFENVAPGMNSWLVIVALFLFFLSWLSPTGDGTSKQVDPAGWRQQHTRTTNTAYFDIDVNAARRFHRESVLLYENYLVTASMVCPYWSSSEAFKHLIQILIQSGRWWKTDHYKADETWIFTARQRSCEKVMFSVMPVILGGGGGHVTITHGNGHIGPHHIRTP